MKEEDIDWKQVALRLADSLAVTAKYSFPNVGRREKIWILSMCNLAVDSLDGKPLCGGKTTEGTLKNLKTAISGCGDIK